MAVLDFFKKKDSVSDDDHDQKQPVQQANTTVSQTTTTTTSSPSGAQSYSGIGNPPGGQAYSGIGNPPQGQAYSGIGNPPVVQQQQTETTVKETSSNSPTVAPTSTPSSEKKETTDNTVQTNKDESNKEQIPATTQNDKNATTTPQEEQGDPNGDPTSNSDQDKRTQLDLMTHLTQRSNRVFMSAQQKAQELKAEFIDSEHVLHGLLADPEIYKLFTENKVPPQIIEQELEKIYKKATTEKPQISPRVKRILENALVVARKLGYEFISPEHILLALYEEGEGAGARILAKLGIKKEQLNKKITGNKEGIDGKDKEQTENRSVLQQYTNDLTAKASQGLLDPVVERSEVIERVIHIISRRTKNNPALVGEAGVGKTAIVEGLAQKIVKKEVPESLLGKKILQLDLMSIIAGASHRGEFEERMKKIIEEITQSQGQIILFIDEIHNLVGAGAGGEGSLDASNFLKPSLARGELQVIGATTLTEYRKYIEKDPALERRFQPIVVPEPTPEQAIKMLKSLKDKYEAFHRVKIPNEAIESAVNLSKRYVGDRFLPDKAVDLMDEACSAVRLPLISLPEEIRSLEERMNQLKQELEENEKSGNKVKTSILKPKVDDLSVELKNKQDEYNQKKSQTTTSISEQTIKDIISRWTGIPISKITESEIEKLRKLEDIIHERLVNQDHAVEPIAQAIRRGRAGLKSNNRPIGSFVFLGPTGVGKTELAKTLAEVLFGQEEAMIRFDMTEYMEKHEVAKLLGAPPGYVGYEEGGKLTEAVRRKPYSVILFDEVEKAHPDIFNILLQILDDGRLTDNKGHVVSFKNGVVICTSNIGTRLIQDEILASGQTDIEEPTIISTYTFSPRGRQLMTIMGKIFEREGEQGKWTSKLLIDYFSGQKVENVQPNDKQQKKEEPTDFPAKEFETHAMSPKGVEMITSGSTLYQRTSTTAKIWTTVNLIDYFKDNVVINALPDAPEQQLPTAKLKTHAFSPSEVEIVTFRERYWKRKASEINWETGTLKDYFENQKLASKPNEKPPDKNDAQKNIFPVNYWDIHTFSPEGKEMVVVGEQLWIKTTPDGEWENILIKDFFGKDFPLDKELSEKQKIEEELSKNQYDRIKSKVMEELRKFFRPELINRFDEVIIFEPLKYQHMLLIADLQLKALKKLLEDQSIGFAWTKPTAKEIVRQGFDSIYGARPLKRTIQKLIENPISTLIIDQKVKESDMIMVDFDGEQFIFNIEKVAFIPESELKKLKKRKFRCIDSKYVFETEVIDTATTICPINAQEKIEEIVEVSEQMPDNEKPLELKKDLPNTAKINAPPTPTKDNPKLAQSFVPPQEPDITNPKTVSPQL